MKKEIIITAFVSVVGTLLILLLGIMVIVRYQEPLPVSSEEYKQEDVASQKVQPADIVTKEISPVSDSQPGGENIPPPSGPYAGWGSYQSTYGFTFQSPPHYRVFERADQEDASKRVVEIAEIGAYDRILGPPKMVMVVDPTIEKVEFSLWEGIEWPYYDGVINTFSFNLK